ncbi:MAG: hypothetical protein H7Y11_05755 [Armatimonadetes bacterium]|nr:hypothetical protein [Anaerolineae bacterium]
MFLNIPMHTRFKISLIVLTIVIPFSVIAAQQDPIPLPPPPSDAAAVTPGLLPLPSSPMGTLSNNVPATTIETQPQTRVCTPNSDPVQPFVFYKPPVNKPVGQLPGLFDLFVFTKGDEDAMRSVRGSGVRPVLQYIKFDAVHDPCFQATRAAGTPCSCSQSPKRNSVAWNNSDICWLRNEHPDWFMRDINGDLLYWNDYVMMDPGEQGWRDFWVERLRTSQSAGWDGIFMDNMSTRFGVHSTDFVELQDYPTIRSYQNAVVGFLETTRDAYFEPNNKLMYANLSVRWGDEDPFYRYLTHLDGVQDEFWAVTRTDWYTLKSWERRLLRAKGAVDRNKDMLLVSLGNETSLTRQQFALASYLLVASPTTYFRYSNQEYYDYVWWYDNYLAKLGEPTGNYTRSGNTWKRNFANGKVTVSPETRSSTIVITDPTGGCLP